MVTPSELALKYAPWSISKIELANTCPQQFNFQYVLRKKKEIKAQDNVVGTLAHRITELALQGTETKEAISTAVKESPMTSSESDDLMCLISPIQSFIDRFYKFRSSEGERELHTEYKLAIDVNGNSVGYDDKTAFFKGVVDLLLVTKSNDVWIIDHKSGKVTRIENKATQLNAYMVLAAANIPNMIGARCGINALGNPQSTQLQWLPYMNKNQIQKALYPWLINYINECAAKLNTFEAKPKEPWPCKWCPYHPSCDAYQGLPNGAKKAK